MSVCLCVCLSVFCFQSIHSNPYTYPNNPILYLNANPNPNSYPNPNPNPNPHPNPKSLTSQYQLICHSTFELPMPISVF